MSVKDSYFESDYSQQKGLVLVKNGFIEALSEKFDKYYLYKYVSNDSGYDVFIKSSNYDEINDLLARFDNIIKYKGYEYISYTIYIYINYFYTTFF